MNLNFSGNYAQPARMSAVVLAEALEEVLRARKALKKAKANIPSYTGQWCNEDYYADEQEAYNRAIDRYEELVKS